MELIIRKTLRFRHYSLRQREGNLPHLAGPADHRPWPPPTRQYFDGSDAEKERAFWLVAQQIQRRLELLNSLPFEKLDSLRLEAATREIGAREALYLDQTTLT